ncbi:MAG: HIT family protein [Halieaceae bacterium]|nr:HIT family protein [Halieaceae bacterium]
MFELDPRLAAGTFSVGSTSLSRVLLMNDARFPWIILVPAREGVSEPFQLALSEQEALWRESMVLAKALKRYFEADKLNIAALGNQVSQLHVHHIVRFRNDDAWPGPVWGVGSTVTYTEAAAEALMDDLRRVLREPLALR